MKIFKIYIFKFLFFLCFSICLAFSFYINFNILFFKQNNNFSYSNIVNNCFSINYYNKNLNFKDKFLNNYNNILNFNDEFFNDYINNNFENKIENRCYTFFYNDKIFQFNSKEIIKNIELTKVQKWACKSKNNFLLVLSKLIKLGLTNKEISIYMFPEIEIINNKLCEIINIYPENNKVEIIKNSCKINFIDGDDGLFINQIDFYEKIFENVKICNINIKINILTEIYNNNENLKELYQEKSCFATNFERSSTSRKNNIRVSLSAFDGIILNEGEILSFNNTTGERNENSGYEKAKIITNGTFIQGFGGGVCQVSTTLYNACLLAGLEIMEVHNHSLPVSYVEPSFDAMVNSGSSDLIIRNNCNGKILITTSSLNNVCKVKIFGEKNKYKITRYSEKMNIIPAENDVIETDYKKFGEYDLIPGQEMRISYSKDGFFSKGYLKFYDENGILIKTEKIRENRYNPTKGVILKREFEN